MLLLQVGVATAPRLNPATIHLPMQRTQILADALAQRPDAIRRYLAEAIRKADSGLVVVRVDRTHSSAIRFAEARHCSIGPAEGFISDELHLAHEDGVDRSPETGWYWIRWADHDLELVVVDLSDGFHRSNQQWLLGPSRDVIEAFLGELNAFDNDLTGVVLVFQSGCWHHSEDLHQDIQSSTFDNLVLPPGLAERIRDDVQGWLDARELYESHGVPWKRGMILVGPPGNGKTHLIKALTNYFGINTLYVRSFEGDYESGEVTISRVFARARATAPSMLILEDLDTLITPQNRSFFLNEMDGFARNTGILVVASANDPSKLDPALVNRPSRFDRRYVIDLPVGDVRARYLTFFTQALNPSLQLSEAEAKAVADLTEGFSVAYLKELVLSSMMSWMGGGRAFAEVLKDNVAPLREQMTFTPPSPPEGE